jgi:hypothetical protein
MEAVLAVVGEHGRWGFWKCFDRLRLDGRLISCLRPTYPPDMKTYVPGFSRASRWSVIVLLAVAACGGPKAAAPKPTTPVSQGSAVPASDPDAKQIDAEVSAIMAGQHGQLPPPQQVRTDPQAQTAVVAVKNDTRYTLRVLYSGPTSRRIVLSPGATRQADFGVGMYRVAATVDEPSMVPFAGTHTLKGGLYSSRFYIEVVRVK